MSGASPEFTVADLPYTAVGALGGILMTAVLLRLALRRIEPRSIGEDDRVRETAFASELGGTLLIGMLVFGAIAQLALTELGGGEQLTDAPIELGRGLIASLSVNAAIALCAILVGRRHGRPARDALSLAGTERPLAGQSLVLGVFAFVAMIPLFLGTATLAKAIVEIAGIPPYQESVRQLLADRDLTREIPIVVGIGIVGPILEEVLFRGMLLRALLAILPRTAAIGLSALLFALVHDVPSMLPIFALGVVFGATYAHTRSIVPSMVAHALFNLAQLVFIIPMMN